MKRKCGPTSPVFKRHKTLSGAHVAPQLTDLPLCDEMVTEQDPIVNAMFCANPGPLQCAKNGCLDKLKAFYKRDERFDVFMAFKHALEGGHSNVLRWLIERRLVDRMNIMDQELHILLAKRADMEIFQLFNNEFDKCMYSYSVLSTLVVNDRFDVLEWFFETIPQRPEYILDIFEKAIEAKQINTVKWICEKIDLKQFVPCENLAKGFCKLLTVAKDTDIETLQIIAEKSGAIHSIFDYNSYWNPAVNSHRNLAVLQWVIEYFDLTREDIFARHYSLLEHAANHGSFDALKWLFETYDLADTLDAGHAVSVLNYASFSNRTKMVKWLVYVFPFTKQHIMRCLQFAFQKSNIAIVEYLGRVFGITKKDIYHAFGHAAQGGQVRMLEWAKEQYNITTKDHKMVRTALKHALAGLDVETTRWFVDTFGFDRNDVVRFTRKFHDANGHMTWFDANFG